MAKDGFKYLCRCMHFADDWEEEDEVWDDKYKNARESNAQGTTNHQRKFGMIEDGYNCRWQAMVNFVRRATNDKSRIAGWYKSPLTIGPEPRPISTGATLHTICITDSPLATYKLFARAYIYKSDSLLYHINDNTLTKQKWIDLYDIMLDSFKGAGLCVTMKSAYMGDVMAQIGREEWGVKMFGTVTDNRTGPGP